MTLLFELTHSDFSRNLADYIDILDIVAFFIYFIAALAFYNSIKKKKVDLSPEYKYFLSGFYIRIIFALIFISIYVFYYGGGDTINYFWSARAVSKLLLIQPGAALSMLFFDQTTWDNWSYFNEFTGRPVLQMYLQHGDSWGAIKLSTPFLSLGFNLWLPAVLVLNIFLYRGIWKFFLLVHKFYPGNMKWNAICILFIPSVLFWSSGFMKDSFTLSSSLWMVTNIYYCFIERRKFFNNFLMLIVNAYIIVLIKPYVFVALIPPALIWISFLYVRTIKNKVFRTMATPAIVGVGMVIGMLVLKMFSSSLGTYGSTDTMLKKAVVVQQDLVRGEQYGDNYYDIGEFDPSISGVLKKAPEAITAGLYRPFLWEARNPVMLISGLENFALLVFTLFIIFRVGVKAVYRVIAKEPLIIFSLIFTLIFSFSVGLATANFGALVRYKIIATPFFLVALVNTYYLIRKAEAERDSKITDADKETTSNVSQYNQKSHLSLRK